MWWPETGLNRRRRPFQGRALPLSYLASVQTSVAISTRGFRRRRRRRVTPRTVRCNNCDSIPTPILSGQTVTFSAYADRRVSRGAPVLLYTGRQSCAALFASLASLAYLALAATACSHAPNSRVSKSEARDRAGLSVPTRARGRWRCTRFLDSFPKGADLHVHLSGAVYAETFIRDAGEDGLCVDTVALKFLPSRPARASWWRRRRCWGT